jgi:PAS domain S-box-containing protein
MTAIYHNPAIGSRFELAPRAIIERSVNSPDHPAAQSPEAVIFADRAGVIRYWGGAAETIFGHGAGEALGNSLDLIIPERFRAAHWTAYDRAIESGQTKYEGRVLTTRSVRKDGGKLFVDLNFVLVKDAGDVVVGALATGRDCTSRYLAERAQREQSAQ